MRTIGQPPALLRRLVPVTGVAAACVLALGSGQALAQLRTSHLTRSVTVGSQTSEPGTGTLTPSASTTVEQCLTSTSQSGRSATFVAQMSSVPGTTHMAIRVDLQERTPGAGSFHTVTAPGLGVWRKSASGVQIYKYLKQVTNLPAPATFRALVHFRWLGEQGRVIRRVQRHTGTCEEPAATEPR